METVRRILRRAGLGLFILLALIGSIDLVGRYMLGVPLFGDSDAPEAADVRGESTAIPLASSTSSGGSVAQSGGIVPARLSIPAIDVDAKVQQVGVGANGNLGIPSNFTDVGWYKHGVKPGAAGNAVIDGHLDNGLGLPAVFNDLGELRPGDEITVTDTAGTMRTFSVTRLLLYDYDSDPRSVFADTGPAKLVLITCDGVWDPQTKNYSKRLVVYADLIR